MGDNAITLVFRVLEAPTGADRENLAAFARAHDVHVLLQTGGPGTIVPLEQQDSIPPLWYALPNYDLKLVFGPLDFIQVNQDMNRLMVDRALQLAQPSPSVISIPSSGSPGLRSKLSDQAAARSGWIAIRE